MKPVERLYGDLRACLCATKPIRCGCVHCDAHDFLQRHRCTIAIGVCASFMVGARCKGFLQRLASAHPQEKEKARSDERA